MQNKNNSPFGGQGVEFYIGYYPNAPKGIARKVTMAIIFIALVLVATAFMITKNESGFANGQFEYGTLTKLEGVLYRKPVPMLRVFMGKDATGNELYKSVLLVNFQKFGAENLLSEFTKQGISESESLVTLQGTLIYHDGVTLMELTEQENALICGGKKVCEQKQTSKPIEIRKSSQAISIRKTEELGELTLHGEIIDPKCYFGAMKPGQSKPHRDCAIRCISGGIPPVFVLKNPSGETNYMLLTGTDGSAINQQILEYVGIPVKLKGNLVKTDEWLVLKVNPKQIEAIN